MIPNGSAANLDGVGLTPNTAIGTGGSLRALFDKPIIISNKPLITKNKVIMFEFVYKKDLLLVIQVAGI